MNGIALARRQVYLETAQQKHSQVQQQIALVVQMRQDLQVLEHRLIEIRNQKELLIARSASASAQLQVNEMLDQTGSSESRRAFERLEEKVNNLEAQVEVNAELEANRLESRFASLTQQQSVEAELTAIKTQLGNPALPTASGSDPELEKIRSELKRL
jgi:phage shock protein A